MIDIQLLRKEPEKLKKAVADKQYDSSIVDAVLELDEEYRKLLNEVESLRAERNKAAKNKDIDKGKQIKKEIQDKEPKLIEAENTLNEKLGEIPNPALPQVPVGKNDKENVEVRLWGEPRKFEFEPKGHLELGTKLGILDFESGSKVTGSQFYYLFDDGALMELALIQYAFELLSAEGFRPVITPDLAKSRYYLGTGYMPKGNEAQTYEIKDEELGLIATAEVTLAGMHADEIIPDEKLPLKYIGYSHCFRREAGAYGKYSKGLYRVHQFTKAEMFIYCKQEESEKMHEHILAMEEKIYQNLGLPYRVVEMCTGDLGAMAARKFDIEAWMPRQGEYAEVTSAGNCTDYQARRLNIKYLENGEKKYCHILNNTMVATSRAMVAILENYQEKNGNVKIPKVLWKYTGFKEIKH